MNNIKKQVDEVTLRRIDTLHPDLIEEVLEIFNDINEALSGKAICRFSYTLRDFDEQDKLYAQGRTTPGIKVTNAKGGQSYHNYGLAIDIVLLIDKDGNGTYETASWDTQADWDKDSISDWMEIVHVFKMYGWTWGGDWKFSDKPHFQKTLGFSIKDLQLKTANKDFMDKSKYLNLKSR